MNEIMNGTEQEGIEEFSSFDGAVWLRGVKVLLCNDKKSIDWCLKAVRETVNGIQVGGGPCDSDTTEDPRASEVTKYGDLNGGLNQAGRERSRSSTYCR